MRIKKSLAKLITWERVCHVATASASGVPHLVPVCHVLLDGKLYFASDADARKVRNLKANPRVAVTVDLYSDDWSNLKGVLVQGTTRFVDKGPRFRKLRRLLYEKYPQYPDEAALHEAEVVIVEVTPAHVFSWGVE
jgi:PPOX class probable F420-dependent enzyme